MAFEQYFVDWIPDSASTLPYLCLATCSILLMSMFWMLLSLCVVALKNIRATGVFVQMRQRNKEAKPKKTPKLQVDAIKQPNGNETEANEQLENETNSENPDGQSKPDPDNDSVAMACEPESSFYARQETKRSREGDDMEFVMDTVVIFQKIFYVVILFLLLVITLHLNLLLVDRVLRTMDVMTDMRENNITNTVAGSDNTILNCCPCRSFPKVQAKSTEPIFGNGPMEKGAKPVAFQFPARIPLEKVSDPADSESLNDDYS